MAVVPPRAPGSHKAAAMARPVRNKKIVDYSQSGDFDDDEDFACALAPPSKKPHLKVDQKPKKGKNVKDLDSQDSKIKKELPKKRLPLDEKIYQRNLKTAFILSVQESTSEANESAEATDTSLHSNCNEDSNYHGMDNTSAENEGVRPRQRQAASGAMVKQRKILLDDQGSDGECEKDSESEQDYVTTEESESNGSNADTDEEFTVKNPSKKTKQKNQIKIQTRKKEEKALHSNSRDKAVPVPAENKPLLEKAMSVSPPSSKSPQAQSPSTGIRKPKWIPPASKENSNASWERVSVRSPSQGLRLGLSRLAKVKPLHPCADNR